MIFFFPIDKSANACKVTMSISTFLYKLNESRICYLIQVYLFFVKLMTIVLTEMTFPRADRDLLIFAPSFNLSPVAPVLSALSEPKNYISSDIYFIKILKIS